MNAFIKKWGWLIIGVLTVAVLVVGYDFVGGYLSAKADAAAKAKYVAKITAAEQAKNEALAERNKLAEQAAKDREEYRTKAEKQKKVADAVFDFFKSESVAKLKARNAKIEEVLTELAKSQIVNSEARYIIESQNTRIQKILDDWKLSDERIEAANKKAMDALILQFQTCTKWSNALEERLKPTFWKRAKQAGIVVLAFGAGRLSAKI